MYLTHRNAKLVAILFAFCVAFTLTGCDDEDEREPSYSTSPSTITGSLNIYYSIQTSDAEVEDTGNTPLKATAIHFYDEYIVIETAGNSGRILPIRQIQSFRWNSIKL